MVNVKTNGARKLGVGSLYKGLYMRRNLDRSSRYCAMAPASTTISEKQCEMREAMQDAWVDMQESIVVYLEQRKRKHGWKARR